MGLGKEPQQMAVVRETSSSPVLLSYIAIKRRVDGAPVSYSALCRNLVTPSLAAKSEYETNPQLEVCISFPLNQVLSLSFTDMLARQARFRRRIPRRHRLCLWTSIWQPPLRIPRSCMLHRAWNAAISASPLSCSGSGAQR